VSSKLVRYVTFEGIDAQAHVRQDAAAIEEDVKDLQKRVYSLSVIIIDKLKVGDSVDEDLQHRIKDLQSCVRLQPIILRLLLTITNSILNSISEDLNEIKDQRKWLLIFFRTLNKDKVEKCVVRINAAMEQFNVRLSSLCGS
jgi:hypothetical protein